MRPSRLNASPLAQFLCGYALGRVAGQRDAVRWWDVIRADTAAVSRGILVRFVRQSRARRVRLQRLVSGNPQTKPAAQLLPVTVLDASQVISLRSWTGVCQNRGRGGLSGLTLARVARSRMSVCVCVCAYTNVFIVLLQLRHCPVSREKERKRE